MNDMEHCLSLNSTCDTGTPIEGPSRDRGGRTVNMCRWNESGPVTSM